MIVLILSASWLGRRHPAARPVRPTCRGTDLEALPRERDHSFAFGGALALCALVAARPAPAAMNVLMTPLETITALIPIIGTGGLVVVVLITLAGAAAVGFLAGVWWARRKY